MSLFFTSDPHYHHVRALELMPHRPWKTLERMNEGLMARYNSSVSEDDVVIFLGDLVMGPKRETVPDIIPKLKGRKYLILGNHDAGFQLTGAKFIEKIKVYLDNGILAVLDGATELTPFLHKCGENALVESLGDLSINLCHFPYKGVADHDESLKPRYFELHPDQTTQLLLHGHTHQTHVNTGPSMLHVGVDSWDFRPVQLERLLECAK